MCVCVRAAQRRPESSAKPTDSRGLGGDSQGLEVARGTKKPEAGGPSEALFIVGECEAGPGALDWTITNNRPGTMLRSDILTSNNGSINQLSIQPTGEQWDHTAKGGLKSYSIAFRGQEAIEVPPEGVCRAVRAFPDPEWVSQVTW